MIREKGRVRYKPTGQIQVNGHTFGGLELGRSSVGKVNIVGDKSEHMRWQGIKPLQHYSEHEEPSSRSCPSFAQGSEL